MDNFRKPLAWLVVTGIMIIMIAIWMLLNRFWIDAPLWFERFVSIVIGVYVSLFATQTGGE